MKELIYAEKTRCATDRKKTIFEHVKYPLSHIRFLYEKLETHNILTFIEVFVSFAKSKALTINRRHINSFYMEN